MQNTSRKPGAYKEGEGGGYSISTYGCCIYVICHSGGLRNLWTTQGTDYKVGIIIIKAQEVCKYYGLNELDADE